MNSLQHRTCGVTLKSSLSSLASGRIMRPMTDDPAGPDPVQRLTHAMRTSTPVLLTYQGAGHDRPHQFVLYPHRVFGRNGHRYVEGWSRHRPSRIRLQRYRHGDAGSVRRFRLDRLIACEAPPPRPRTPLAYAMAQIRRRGIMMALWGWFLDLCVIGFVVGLVLGVLRVAGYQPAD